MAHESNYDKYPFLDGGTSADCVEGWDAIALQLTNAKMVCVECYPGARVDDISSQMAQRFMPDTVINASRGYKSSAEIHAMLTPYLGDDRVFGHMNELTLKDWFRENALNQLREEVIEAAARGTVLLIGSGAALLASEPDILVYADIARWEIQLRYRRFELGNLGCDNAQAGFAEKYKCGFFAEWRAADRLKKEILSIADFLLDTNNADAPKMVRGLAFREALARAVQRPFRVVPYFDPGPWGGHWMEEVCGLPNGNPNYAWCFDCVPEENSLLLGYGEKRVEVPAINLVITHPRKLLGESVYARFGAEFPIRFDFLDTMGGGNLSLQVHPLTGYIQRAFGMDYTQDESYYLLDAGPDATVYLGLREDANPNAMAAQLHQAQAGEIPFDAERFVNRFPAAKHDHFLIPAGTVHCSGQDGMVLEISATPDILTFKLWDWGRMGLNGEPRPIHLQHGLANIQWDRRTEWVKNNLINRLGPLASSDGWREERTGLHQLEFIETRRHWFTGKVPHHTNGTVNVVNLVQGQEATVESPENKFEPFVVHYAETFIVPAAVGKYTVRPPGPAAGPECATLKAFVRTNP